MGKLVEPEALAGARIPSALGNVASAVHLGLGGMSVRMFIYVRWTKTAQAQDDDGAVCPHLAIYHKHGEESGSGEAL